MSDPSAKTGPLSAADVQALWEGAADEEYVRPLEEAGDGFGLEVWGQLFAQLARASEAVDVTFESLFVLPWSGQTNPPAAGAGFATVELTLLRGQGFANVPLLLGAGLFVEEWATDWSPDGPVQVSTGRRYALTKDAFFFPGQTFQPAQVGPRVIGPGQDGGLAPARAEGPGYGYNNPWPGTLTRFSQPGSGYSNDGASVSFAAGQLPPPSGNLAVLTAANEPDMFTPDHLGQYVRLTAGSNVGVVARATQYFPPRPSSGAGSGVQLEQLVCFQGLAVDTTFVVGEPVQVLATVGNVLIGEGRFVAQRDVSGVFPTNTREAAFVLTSGVVTPPVSFSQSCFLFAPGSNSFGNVQQITWYPTFVPEAGTAAWRVLDWSLDLGVTVTNAAQPAGGVAPMLDALGLEKGLRRSFGEDDSSFSRKVATPADVVSPNAIRRALNRVLDTLSWCFREVGSPLLPGFFYDKPGPAGDYWDSSIFLFHGTQSVVPAFSQGEHVLFKDASGGVQAEGYFGGTPSAFGVVYRWANPRVLAGSYVAGDIVVSANPANTHNIHTLTSVPSPYDAPNRHHVWLSFGDMRAYFLVGLARPSSGEFGFAYDESPLALGFYDELAGTGFYDGYPLASAGLYKQLWDDLWGRKAGGVGIDFEIEDIGCS